MATDDNKVHLTKEGLENIKNEYQTLVDVKRPEVVERLSESRQLGDLAENNEYIQARQELSFMDGRIAELEAVIKKVVLINDNHNCCQKVSLGCRITVQTETKDAHVFWLVGEWEADPLSKKISCTSPLGKSLLGKKVGEKVEVDAPAGKISYTITQIN